MKNITEIIKNAISSNVIWNVSIFYLVIETLNNNGNNLSYWEEEENWASIVNSNKVVGYIWKKYPLIVLEKGITNLIKEQLKDVEMIYYIEVDSLTEDLFKIEGDDIKCYFENFHNYNSFTMEDLWFQTNSI